MEAKDLLELTKQNLVLEHSEDDGLLLQYISAGIAYAEGFQNKGNGYYKTHDMLESTRQAVVLLASFFYESRDGSSAGFFQDSPQGASQVWETCHYLLRRDKDVIL